MQTRTKLYAAFLAAVLVGEIAGGLPFGRQPSLPPAPSSETAAAPFVDPAPPPARSVVPRGTSAARIAKEKPPPKRVNRLVAVTDDGGSRTRTSVDRSGGSSAPARSTSELERQYPKQFAAKQVEGYPASFHWALIIGIGDYVSAADTVGSRQDAEALRKYLLDLGWRSDHILLLTDRRATAKAIVQSLKWLASKTTSRSTVVFHYAGHEMPITKSDPDRDGEARDVAIWATDNKLVVDGDLGYRMSKVRAQKMWIHLATCRAAGFNDAGMSKAGRVITYSSPEREFSYEDPDLRHSVFGYHMIVRGMRDKLGDRNGDGRVSVEEAFTYADPRVEQHTDGNQHPLMVDRYDGGFTLKVPPRPAPAPSPSPAPSEPECDLVVCPPAARTED